MTESNGFTPEVSGVREVAALQHWELSLWMPPALEPRHLAEMGWVVRGPQPMPERIADTEPPPARVVPVRMGRRWLVIVSKGGVRREFVVYRSKEPKKGELVFLLQHHFPLPLTLSYTIEVLAAEDADHWSDGSVGKVLEDKAPARETRK
jgi:hypothetical protein